jgi:hypothetical protein
VIDIVYTIAKGLPFLDFFSHKMFSRHFNNLCRPTKKPHVTGLERSDPKEDRQTRSATNFSPPILLFSQTQTAQAGLSFRPTSEAAKDLPPDHRQEDSKIISLHVNLHWMTHPLELQKVGFSNSGPGQFSTY